MYLAGFARPAHPGLKTESAPYGSLFLGSISMIWKTRQTFFVSLLMRLLGVRLMEPLDDTLMDPSLMARGCVRKGRMIHREKVLSVRHYSKGGVSMKLSLAQIRQIQEYLEQGMYKRKIALSGQPQHSEEIPKKFAS